MTVQPSTEASVDPAAELQAALLLIRDLVSEEECWRDHHGGCQAHSYLSLGPEQMCPHDEGKQMLARHGMGVE